MPGKTPFSKEWRKGEAEIEEASVTAQDHTGGEHGGQYTKTFQLAVTLAPALNELANSINKQGDKISQKRCRKLLRGLAELGFKPEMLQRPEAAQLPSEILQALIVLYQVKLQSVASTDKFNNSPQYFEVLASSQIAELKETIKSALKQVFPEEINYVFKDRSQKAQGFMAKPERQKITAEIDEYAGPNNERHKELARKLEELQNYFDLENKLGKLARNAVVFEVKLCKNETIRNTLKEQLGEQVNAEALLLTYFRITEERYLREHKLDDLINGITHQISWIRQMFDRLLGELQGYSEANFRSNKYVDQGQLIILKEIVLPELVKASDEVFRLKNTELKAK